MKKYIMLLSFIASISYSSLSLGLSTSYENFKIESSEFEKAAIKDLMSEGYKSKALITSLELEALYPIKAGDFSLKFGTGLNLFLENKLSKVDISTSEKSEKYSLALANYNSEKSKMNLLNEEKSDLKYGMAKIEDAITKYNELLAEEESVDENLLEQKLEELMMAKMESGEEITEEDQALLLEEATALATVKKSAYQTKKESYEKDKQEYTDRKEKYEREGTLAKYQEQNNTLIENLKTLYAELDALELQHREMEKDIANLRTKEETEKAKEEADKVYEQFQDKKKEIEVILTERKNLKGEIEKVQDIDKYIANIEKAIEELDKEYATAQEKLPLYEARLEELMILLEEQETKILAQDEKLVEVSLALEEYNKSEIEKERSKNIILNTLNSKTNIGLILEGIGEIEYRIFEDLDLFTNLRAGLKVYKNPVYTVAEELEANKAIVNGSQYIKPITLNFIELKPSVSFGLGLKYKGFKTEGFIGYNKGMAGIKLSYEF